MNKENVLEILEYIENRASDIEKDLDEDSEDVCDDILGKVDDTERLVIEEGVDSLHFHEWGLLYVGISVAKRLNVSLSFTDTNMLQTRMNDYLALIGYSKEQASNVWKKFDDWVNLLEHGKYTSI